MKKYRIFLVSAVLITFALLLSGYNDSYYFKINKSFEIFGEAFKRISTHYVHEIDPEILLKDGIEGMLKNLDPYTVYIDESESDNLEIITYGRYTGLGISVSKMDKWLTITDIRQNYPAAKAGIRIGDRIVKIDSVDLTNMSSNNLREYTRGEEGTKLDMYILRDEANDTLKFTLRREQIQLENVPYSGILSGGIAYIKLDRFSKNSAEDIKKALNDLKRNHSLAGLILDLRGNPGGIMEAAVHICEIFVESGSEIVSTRGRNEDRARTYKSFATPIEADLPLAVLIDRGSASASEIVAGAIQDLDRGIIIGENSLGKGLVQTVFNLPYKANLKVTTAKYYTPSGRCIQKIDYSPKHLSSSNKDTSYFYTKNGRAVPELDGIRPDTIVKYPEYSEYVNSLQDKNMIFSFANKFRNKNDSIPKELKADIIIKEFKEYLKYSDFLYKSPLQIKLEELKKIASERPYNNSVLKKVEALEKELKSDKTDYVEIFREDIFNLLEFEIYKRYMFEKELNGRFLEKDIQVKTALNVLKKDVYEKIISGSDNNSEKGKRN